MAESLEGLEGGNECVRMNIVVAVHNSEKYRSKDAVMNVQFPVATAASVGSATRRGLDFYLRPTTCAKAVNSPLAFSAFE